MSRMFDSRAPETTDHSTRRPLGLSVAAAAVLVLLVLIPYLPAGWRALQAFDRVGVGTTGLLGVVNIERCQRAALPWAWSCSGTFQVNDPMAEPYPPSPGVVLRDDSSFHATGTAVDSTIAVGSRDAYRWGGIAQARTLLLWGGVALAFAALVLGVSRRSRAKLATAALTVSILLLAVARPI